MVLLLAIATNFQCAFIKKHKYHIVSVSVRIYKIFLNLERKLTAILTTVFDTVGINVEYINRRS